MKFSDYLVSGHFVDIVDDFFSINVFIIDLFFDNSSFISIDISCGDVKEAFKMFA